MSKYPNLAALGRIYLGDHQPDSRISPTPRLETVSDMQAFQQQVSKCFCAGETVVIDGWYLSDIEAQLCVALYLHMRK